MAQGLIRPGCGPNRLPTSPPPTHARCSTAGRRVYHAAERALHCRRESELHATRHPAPCGSKCGRPSCPGIPHSLSPFLALSLCARARQSGATMAAAAKLPCHRCSLSYGPPASALSVATRPMPHAAPPVPIFQSPQAAVSPSPSEQPAAFHLCVRPGQLGPPPVDLNCPTRVRRSLEAPRRFSDAVDDHSRRSREPGRSPALPSRGGRRLTTRENRSFSRGLSEEVMTQVNSAQEDHFADV